MKFASIILCGALLAICSGCKKEVEHVDRFKVFSATWEETEMSDQGTVSVAQKKLIKYDSVTGRVWYWNQVFMASTNKNSTTVLAGFWAEMKDNVVNINK